MKNTTTTAVCRVDSATCYRAGRMTFLAVSTIGAMMFLAAGCSRLSVDPSSRGHPPTAVVSVAPATGTVPLEVTVDSSESKDPDGRIVLRELSIDGGPYEEVGETHPLTFIYAGDYFLTLRVTDDSGKRASAETTVSVEPPPDGGSGFRIDVLYPQGRVSAREREAFEWAARRWGSMVTGDLRDMVVTAENLERACGSDYRYSGPIDDLLLFGDVRELDGSGGVVGMAGPCLLRSDDFPIVGVIILDSADVDFLASSGDLETVVLHELGHVLDMSVQGWQRRDLLYHNRPACYESEYVRFNGSVAKEEFERMGGVGDVPVEDNGVLGTACSHWDEETFRSELMTGYLDRNAPLSRLTVGALADMGYQVDLDAADPYSLPHTAEVRPQSTGMPINERLLPPASTLDDDGRVHPPAHLDTVHTEPESLRSQNH